MTADDKEGGFAAAGRFATTRWSIVWAAGRQSAHDSQAALAELCRAYWYPLYVFVRRRGYSIDDAQELTQEFFTRLIEKDYVQAADQQRGRFRSFLLTMFKRFLTKERERSQARKRGGDRQHFSIDVTEGEERYCYEPTDDWTPDRIYERRWALTILDKVLAGLSDEYARRQKSQQFEQLKIYLTASSAAPTYAAVADELGLSQGAVKVAVYRLREMYRERLRQEIADTIMDPEDVDDERRHLLAAIRGDGQY